MAIYTASNLPVTYDTQDDAIKAAVKDWHAEKARATMRANISIVRHSDIGDVPGSLVARITSYLHTGELTVHDMRPAPAAPRATVPGTVAHQRRLDRERDARRDGEVV